jgi:adenylylsulfate kinase-like enzyme
MRNKKKIKFNKKYGLVFWITGISGSGKTTLCKNIYPFIKKRFGPTILLSGDNLRRIFKLNNYDKNYRKQLGKKYTLLLKHISANKINILFSVVGLFHELHNYNRKQLKNYIEILIDSNFKKTELRKQKFFYKNKINNVWGRDIKPEYPKKPHIVLKNDFKKNKNSLSIELIKKINDLRFKFI